MNQIKYIQHLLISSALIFTITGCGGGGSDDIEPAIVKDVRVDPDAIRVGAKATITIDFDPVQVTDDEGAESIDPTEVVILIPSGMEYVNESSELDGSIFDGFENRDPDSIEHCGNGSTALRYSLDDSEMSTLGDNRIRINTIATEARGLVAFTAEADSLIGTPCGILGTDIDQITILP